MNNIEIWVQLTERHTTWNDPAEVVKLRARGLKALIDQAYECGKEDGQRLAAGEYQRGFNEGKKHSPWKDQVSNDLYNRLFGKN
jgi:hypothetical protein